MNVFRCCQNLLEKRRERNVLDVDPWRFKEENRKYHVCCGFFHVKPVIIIFTLAKTLFILWYIASSIIEQKTGVLTLVSCFAVFLIMTSYVFLIVGVVIKKYTFVIPYFTICVMLILVLTLKLFIEIMSSANTKDTLKAETLQKLLFQAFLIMIEIYSVFVVWRVFNYITDYYMEAEFCANTKLAEQKRLQAEEMEEARVRRKTRAELLKLQDPEPRRKPTFPALAALIEEARHIDDPERNPSEMSSSSSGSKEL